MKEKNKIRVFNIFLFPLGMMFSTRIACITTAIYYLGLFAVMTLTPIAKLVDFYLPLRILLIFIIEYISVVTMWFAFVMLNKKAKKTVWEEA